MTIVFTDVEGATPRWERLGEAFDAVLNRHSDIIREALGETGGIEVKHEGDGFMLAFGRASAAVAFALRAQIALSRETWSDAVGALRVRMGMHTGEAMLRPGLSGSPDYFGTTVSRASRICNAGHGGQTLLSSATLELLGTSIPEGATVVPLGLHRLRGLEQPERLYQLTHPDLPIREFPPLRTLDAQPNNLPLQLSSFVGREGEVRALRNRVCDPRVRVVTLAGSGGVGKSRLALEVALDVLHTFPDGAWFVPLEDLAQAGRVPEVIAAALGLSMQGKESAKARLMEHLAERRLLLVLDSFEQVIGAAPLLRELLLAAPGLRCIVTSRRVLHVSGEHVFAVEPMQLPAPDADRPSIESSESVQLLAERARAHRPDWEVTDENAHGIAELCRRLDGVPLAIELAASRLGRMSVREILQRLDRRFQILVGQQPDLPPRLRALRTTIELSYELLTREQQQLLVECSVFHGGFTMDAAESVCTAGDVFEGIFGLCDHSLLSAREVGGSTRYSMFESIREFALEIAAGDHRTALHERHAAYCLAFARERTAQLNGPGEPGAFRELEAELDNLRAALDWAAGSRRGREFAELVAACAEFLWRRGYWDELADRLDFALDRARGTDAAGADLRLALLRLLAQLHADRGDLEGAERASKEGLALAGQAGAVAAEAALRNIAGLVYRRRRNREAARGAFEESLRLARSAGDRRAEGLATHNLALLAQDVGDVDAARQLYEQALPLRREGGDVRGAGEVANNLGYLAETEGRWDVAAECYREALGELLRVGDTLGTAVALSNLGEAALRTGHTELARELLSVARAALAGMGSAHAAHTANVLAEAGGEPGGAVAVSAWRRRLFEAAASVADGATPG